MKKLLVALVLMLGSLFVMIPTGLACTDIPCCGNPVLAVNETTGKTIISGWYNDKKPTCQRGAHALIECSNCGGYYKKFVPKDTTAHDFPEGLPKDCTKGIYCANGCGTAKEGYTPQKNHAEVPQTCHHGKTCSNPGCKWESGSGSNKHTEADFLPATCELPKRCKEPTCPYTVGDPLGHKLKDTKCGQVRKCSRCQKPDPEGSKTKHKYQWKTTKEPTCGANGTDSYQCTKCGDVQKTRANTNKPDHTYKNNWTIQTYATCTKDGKKTRRCVKCSQGLQTEIIKASHSYTKVISDITKPSGQRVVIKECDKCGNRITNIYNNNVQ